MIPVSSASLVSTRKGEYHLIALSEVIEIYRSIGVDITDDASNPPHIVNVSGKECLFTGELLDIDETTHEVVMVANGFSWEDLLDDDEDDHDHAHPHHDA